MGDVPTPPVACAGGRADGEPEEVGDGEERRGSQKRELAGSTGIVLGQVAEVVHEAAGGRHESQKPEGAYAGEHEDDRPEIPKVDAPPRRDCGGELRGRPSDHVVADQESRRAAEAEQERHIDESGPVVDVGDDDVVELVMGYGYEVERLDRELQGKEE